MEKELGKFIDCINRVNSTRINMVPPMFMKYCLGLANEGGEMLEMLKDALYYGEEIDYAHVQEELGDALYFVVLGCMHLSAVRSNVEEEITAEEIFLETMSKIVRKLDTRFPNGFTEKNARRHNRNLAKEKEAMQSIKVLESLYYRKEANAPKKTSDNG